MFHIILTLISVPSYGVFKCSSKDRHFWLKRGIPEVNRTTWKFITGKKSLAEIYKDLYESHPYDDNVGTYVGNKPSLLVRNLVNVQMILLGDFQSFYSRGIVTHKNDLLTDNVLMMDDYKIWRIVKQKLSPVFTSKHLKNMFYIIERCARDFFTFVDKDDRVKERHFTALYTYTTISIASSVFRIDTHTKNTMNSPFLEMAWKSSGPTFVNNFKIANTIPKLFNLLNLNVFVDHEEFFIGAVKRVLEDRRGSCSKIYDFIDNYLDLQQEGIMQDSVTGYKLEPSDELMAAQAFFFFIAGADTSAHTMHFALLELLANLIILQKVHNEIDDTLEKCNETITYKEIDEMKYLNMVMNEAMRIYPTVGVIQQKCTKDTVLLCEKVEIKKEL